MQRRTFLSLAGVIGLQASDSGLGNLEHYYLNSEREMLSMISYLKRTRPRALVLEAIAAAHTPQLAVVPRAAGLEGAGVVEKRVYRGVDSGELSCAFSRAGIVPALSFGGATPTFLIPFADLAARDKAWSRFSAERALAAEISIFRPIS